MVRPDPQSTCVALCAAGAALCSQQTAAAEWRVEPSAYLGTSYADNPRLRADGGTSTAGTVGEAQARLKRLTERSELTLHPRLVSSRYSDDETLDSDDRFLSASYRWLGVRSKWNMELGLTQDTTLTSELGSTGLVESNRRHEAATFSIAPEVMFTERVSGGVQMYVLDSRYHEAELTGLVDYRYSALSLFSTVVTTDAGSAVTITAQGGKLTTEGFLGAETRDASMRLGWNFQPWLLWTVSLSAGPSLVEKDAGSDTGFVLDGEIQRQGDRWSLTASAGRSQSPTGRGVLTRRDEAKVSFNRSITERLGASIGARYVSSEDLLPLPGRVTTYQADYAQLNIAAHWRLARDWSLSLQLSGNTQDYDLATERADGYRASLNVIWNGQPQSL